MRNVTRKSQDVQRSSEKAATQTDKQCAIVSDGGRAHNTSSPKTTPPNAHPPTPANARAIVTVCLGLNKPPGSTRSRPERTSGPSRCRARAGPLSGLSSTASPLSPSPNGGPGESRQRSTGSQSLTSPPNARCSARPLMRSAERTRGPVPLLSVGTVANYLGWSRQVAARHTYAVPGEPRLRNPLPGVRLLGRRNLARRELTFLESTYLEATLGFDLWVETDWECEDPWGDIALAETERLLDWRSARGHDVPRADVFAHVAALEAPPRGGLRMFRDRIDRLVAVFRFWTTMRRVGCLRRGALCADPPTPQQVIPAGTSRLPAPIRLMGHRPKHSAAVRQRAQAPAVGKTAMSGQGIEQQGVDRRPLMAQVAPEEFRDLVLEGAQAAGLVSDLVEPRLLDVPGHQVPSRTQRQVPGQQDGHGRRIYARAGRNR